MNRAQAWQYAQAQSKVGAKSPRPLDPRTNAMNHHKARLANASVADATKMPSNTNVRPNELSDGNHENNRLKADILPPTDATAELNQAKTALSAAAKNWEKIQTSLVHGTFRRPGWLPKESWQRIIRAGYDVSVAW